MNDVHMLGLDVPVHVLGLDVPVHMQYGRRLEGISLHGTLGESLMAAYVSSGAQRTSRAESHGTA